MDVDPCEFDARERARSSATKEGNRVFTEPGRDRSGVILSCKTRLSTESTPKPSGPRHGKGTLPPRMVRAAQRSKKHGYTFSIVSTPSTTYVPACSVMVESGSAASTSALKSPAMLKLRMDSKDPSGTVFVHAHTVCLCAFVHAQMSSPHLEIPLRQLVRRDGTCSLAPSGCAQCLGARSTPSCARGAAPAQKDGNEPPSWNPSDGENDTAATHASNTYRAIVSACNCGSQGLPQCACQVRAIPGRGHSRESLASCPRPAAG